MDDVAQTVQPVVYSGLQNYQCFYQFKIISCQKLSIFISILYQLKLSILKIINYLLSILYQFLYQSSSKIINISKLSILKIINSGEGIRTPDPAPRSFEIEPAPGVVEDAAPFGRLSEDGRVMCSTRCFTP